MTSRTHYRLTVIGFCLLYLSTVGSLVVVAMPLLDDYQLDILLYFMLPAGVVGLAAIALEKSSALTV